MDLAEATARDQARDDLNFGSYYRPIRCTQPYIRYSGAIYLSTYLPCALLQPRGLHEGPGPGAARGSQRDGGGRGGCLRRGPLPLTRAHTAGGRLLVATWREKIL